jgi:hypothetical protein
MGRRTPGILDEMCSVQARYSSVGESNPLVQGGRGAPMPSIVGHSLYLERCHNYQARHQCSPSCDAARHVAATFRAEPAGFTPPSARHAPRRLESRLTACPILDTMSSVRAGSETSHSSSLGVET